MTLPFGALRDMNIISLSWMEHHRSIRSLIISFSQHSPHNRLIQKLTMNRQVNQTMDRLKDLLPLSHSLPNSRDAAVPSTIFLPSACMPQHERLSSSTSRLRQRSSLPNMKASSMIPSMIAIPSFSLPDNTEETPEIIQECTCPRRNEHDAFSTNMPRWEDLRELSFHQLPSQPARRPDHDYTLCDPTPPKMPQRSAARRRHSDPLPKIGGSPPKIPLRSSRSC